MVLLGPLSHRYPQPQNIRVISIGDEVVRGIQLMMQWLKRTGWRQQSVRQEARNWGRRRTGLSRMGGAIALFLASLGSVVSPTVAALDTHPDSVDSSDNPTLESTTIVSTAIPSSTIESTAIASAPVTQLPDILFDIIPPEIIPDSEFIAQISELVGTVGDRQKQYALLTAGVLASQDPNISRWLAALESSPFQEVEINGLELGDFAQQLAATVEERDATVEAIARQADQEALANNAVNYANRPDLRQPGRYSVHMQALSVGDTDRATEDNAASVTESGMTVEAYFPESLLMGGLMGIEPDAAPIILVSHGVGGDAEDFAPLAQHLASYGFVVVVPDHEQLAANEDDAPTSPLDRLRSQFSGAMNPVELVKRPLTLSAILDEMERLNELNPMFQGRLDLDNVGVIGHSLGGYTGLAMVTGDISRRRLRRTCTNDEALALNLSLLLQCQARALPRRLPSLSDDRIKAVMALNPVGSAILGKRQIEDIDVPVMLVAGSHDAIAPMLSEQLPMFSWLGDRPDKYLVTLVPGGHASANAMADDLDAPENNATTQPDLVDQITTGPLNPQGGDATKALSVAFMATHLASPVADEIPTDTYLNAAYGEFLSEGAFDLHLITEWGDQR
ncbi:MAG: alpha/beta hydrolase family protein [Leptolyngbyaceae cyanobacterium]